jgi:serine phosphatase RsbU (regulator of sigma subunit)
MIPSYMPTDLKGVMASDLVALGKTDEAEKIFQTAINSYINAAKFLDITYETKTDTSYYYTAVELDLEAAKAYIKAMQYDKAQQWLEKTKQTISESEQYTDSLGKYRDAFLFDVHLMDALVLTHQGKAAEAERAYAACLEKKQANDPSAINMRLQYLKAAHRYQDIPALFHQFDSLLVRSDVAMNIDNISQILAPQYAAYRGMGQTAQALMMADSITQVLDSAIIAARNDNAAELATIYETQKKEAQISKQNNALSIMRLMWIIAILVVGIFIYVGYTILSRRSERRMAAMRAAQERIENELKIARDIQMSMVPSTFPEREGLDMYASMTPAKEVGGDLYGYVMQGDRLYFALGDVSGKGVPASLFMAQATRLFMTLAKQGMMPVEICTRMNDALSGEDNESGMFVTLFLGLVDLTTGHLDFCNAGHNPPVIGGGENNADFLEMQPNAPIGLWPGLEYEGEEIDSIKGRPLFIYTDGLNEAENRQQEQFGDDRLLDILRHTQFDTAQQVIDTLKAEVEQHRDGAEPNDDLTMMCIRVD